MQVLEKILEEIEKEAVKMYTKKLPHQYYKAVGTRKIEEIIHSHMDEAKDINVPSNDGWISVDERLPGEWQKVLVWYEYFRYGEYNRMFKTYGIGWQFDGHWSGDVSGTKARCIAWHPLPEPYRQKEVRI